MKLMIKYIFVFCSICIIYAFRSIPLQQQTTPESSQTLVKWMSWEEATAQHAKDEKKGKAKKLFVDIYTDWCGWCKKMDKDVFDQPNIAAYLNTHFYPVKLNGEERGDIKFNGRVFKYIPNGRRGYNELPAELMNGKMSYPTVVFLDEKIKIIQSLPGYQKSETFNVILHYFGGDHYKNVKWEVFQERFLREKSINNK